MSEHQEPQPQPQAPPVDEHLADTIARDVRLTLSRVQDLDIRAATIQLELAALAGLTLLLVTVLVLKSRRTT
jgi:hypothetical protein